MYKLERKMHTGTLKGGFNMSLCKNVSCLLVCPSVRDCGCLWLPGSLSSLGNTTSWPFCSTPCCTRLLPGGKQCLSEEPSYHLHLMQPFIWPRAHQLSPHLTVEDFPTFVRSPLLWEQPQGVMHWKPEQRMTLYCLCEEVTGIVAHLTLQGKLAQLGSLCEGCTL